MIKSNSRWVFPIQSAIVILFLTIVCLAVLLIIQQKSIWESMNFERPELTKITGVLNNLITPLITLVSVLLLYRTLNLQIQLNESQELKHSLDTINALYAQLNQDYGNIYYEYKPIGSPHLVKTYYGVEALLYIKNQYYKNPEKIKTTYNMDSINLVIATFKIVENNVRGLKDIESRALFEAQLKSFYDYKLRDYIGEMCHYVKGLRTEDQPIEMFTFFVSKQAQYYPNFDLYKVKDLPDLFKY